MLPLVAAMLAATPAPLPDPLVMADGRRVTTRAEWEATRKPELKEQFERLMYGHYPKVKPAIVAKVVYEDKAALGGKATLHEVALTVAPGTPPVYWLIVTPNGAAGPVPMFIGLNFTGNHTLTADPKVHLPEGWMAAARPGVTNSRATDAGRNTSTSWPLADIVGRGFGLATAYYGDIIPDNPSERGGLSNLLRPVLDGTLDPAGTGAVMAWAWGLHRGVDYLLTLPEVDAKRIIAVGHSRLGKTAIVAAAFDDRIAGVIPSQAGCGGTAPSRRTNPKGEPVDRINKSFPHWFCDNFKAFGADATKLPFDQNGLVALCAPRPVLFSNATDDQWADPAGQFEVLKAAAPVYALYGVKDAAAAAADYPAENLRVGGKLGFWVRPGKHSMTAADWGAYLDWAAAEVT